MRRSELLKASPPMFESPWLDRFTRVHPVVPVLLFLPGDRRRCSRSAPAAPGVSNAVGLAWAATPSGR